jgi:integrase
MEKTEKPVKEYFKGIKLKPGSTKLYIDLRYNGKRIEKSTGLDDSPENRLKAKNMRDEILKRIDDGTFVFANVFPRVSTHEKMFHAEREGWEYSPDPLQILFGGYARKWIQDVLMFHDSHTKRHDSLSIINYWLLPYFGDVPFARITAKKIKEFILQHLKWQSGTKAGERLSQKRIRNIMIPFREIWIDACVEYGWNLPNPFLAVAKKNLPKSRQTNYEVYRFEEIMKLLECMDPHYRMITEFFLLTGLGSSELAGIKKNAVHGDHISIQYKVTRRTEGKELKTEYRVREVPVTRHIKRIVDIMTSKSEGEYVFTLKNGRVFNDCEFRKIWMKASYEAGVVYRKPYTTRHTFAAWALMLRVDPNRLVSLMGHGSKKMIFEVYGKYKKGLEQDYHKILGFFGKDFLTSEMYEAPGSSFTYGESLEKVVENPRATHV